MRITENAYLSPMASLKLRHHRCGLASSGSTLEGPNLLFYRSGAACIFSNELIDDYYGKEKHSICTRYR